MDTRINNALILLKSGGAYQIGDIYLRMKDEKSLMIYGKTNYSNLKFLTKEEVLDEINEMKSIFLNISECSEDFYIFIQNKNIEYVLMDSLTKGDPICAEKNGVITWFMTIPD